MDNPRNSGTHRSMSSNTVLTKSGQSGAKPKIRHAFFRTIEAAGADWDTVAAKTGNIFLQRDYLHCLELAPPHDMRFGYLVFYKDDQPAGIAVCQTRRFSAADSISSIRNENQKEPCFFTGLARWFKKWVAEWVDDEILVCGNLMLTGQHGFWFDPAHIPTAEVPQLLYEALQASIPKIEKNGTKIALILIKDVHPENQPSLGRYFVQKQFVEFEIQPNMVLHLEEFADFDAYLGAMTTKYRTRVKRAFKKAESLKFHELSKNEVIELAPELFELYKSVAKSVGFNAVDLHSDYMPVLHRIMDSNFRIFGYFRDHQLVSYCTTLKNGDELEAHFLGYNKDLNHDYQLYLNMLYQMIGIAFSSGCKKVVFARTALEIKSSVGAVPEDLYCYLKHMNPLVNNFTSTILDYLKPVEEWQQRHPFKHSQPAHGEESDHS